MKLLRKNGLNTLEGLRILDVGCGKGLELLNLMRYGAKQADLFGMDLLSDRLEEAKKNLPHGHLICGNAESLPYEDSFFDIVVQFTVFTSILEDNMKQNIALQMLRVLKENGIIIWHDFFFDNPRNPSVRGVRKQEIMQLFPSCSITLKRITLAPPFARFIGSYSVIACHFLERLKILNTHYLGIIRKV